MINSVFVPLCSAVAAVGSSLNVPEKTLFLSSRCEVNSTQTRRKVNADPCSCLSSGSKFALVFFAGLDSFLLLFLCALLWTTEIFSQYTRKTLFVSSRCEVNSTQTRRKVNAESSSCWCLLLWSSACTIFRPIGERCEASLMLRKWFLQNNTMTFWCLWSSKELHDWTGTILSAGELASKTNRSHTFTRGFVPAAW